MMMNARFSKPLVLAVGCTLASFALSCSEKPQETPTEGNLEMITSEDVAPVIDKQVHDFTRLYEKARVRNLHSSTRDAVVQLLNDSVTLIVIPREFNAEERAVVEKNELDVASTKIAYDGVAVIANTRNGLGKVRVKTLHDILTGIVAQWQAVDGSLMSGSIVVGMGGPNSGVYEYLKERIAPTESFAPVIRQCETSVDVITFVAGQTNAIGFVPISWLRDTPATVKVLEVGDPAFKRDSTSTTLEFFSPEQAYIYQGFYPLSRPVYLYTHNARGGVAVGFASFAAGAEGQKIIVKNGLVPATMPVRLVQLNQQ